MTDANWPEQERRAENFCNEHSGVCVRINHVEENVEKVVKRLNQLIGLVVMTLIAIIANILVSHLSV